MNTAKHTSKRAEAFVSLAIVVTSLDAPEHGEWISTAVEKLAAAYQFAEMLIVGPVSSVSAQTILAPLQKTEVPVRILQTNRTLSYDQTATIAYEEAIGDFLVVTSIEELQVIDLLAVFELLQSGQSLVRLRRSHVPWFDRASARLIRLLTGFETDPYFLRSIGISRALLADLLTHPQLANFFRFRTFVLAPNQSIIQVEARSLRKGRKAYLNRLEITGNLLSMAAPRLLLFMIALQTLLGGIALSYMFYAMLTWLLKASVAEGWTSLSLAIAGGIFVQAATAIVLCLGLFRLLEYQQRRPEHRVLGEISGSDVFRSFSELNIETETKEPA